MMSAIDHEAVLVTRTRQAARVNRDAGKWETLTPATRFAVLHRLQERVGMVLTEMSHQRQRREIVAAHGIVELSR